MSLSSIVEKSKNTKIQLFSIRHSLSITNKIILAFLMAVLTGMLAQIRIYLPFTPIPITGQVLGVLLSGVICGGLFGSISQLMYISLGLSGLQWFAVANASWTTFFVSPTSGYLLGFIAASYLIGSFQNRDSFNNSFSFLVKKMVVGTGIIYLFGASYMAFLLKLNIWQTVMMGILPFVWIDLIKAVAAAGISKLILPTSRE